MDIGPIKLRKTSSLGNRLSRGRIIRYALGPADDETGLEIK